MTDIRLDKGSMVAETESLIASAGFFPLYRLFQRLRQHTVALGLYSGLRQSTPQDSPFSVFA